MSSGGDQVPVIPLSDVVGKADSDCPAQIGATWVKVGVVDGLTVIVSCLIVAHCPALGVKVYVWVWVLLSGGDQVPVIPLSDVVGSGAIKLPSQTAGKTLNNG